MKKTIGAACAAALIAALAPLPHASAAGDTVSVNPRKLDRGDDVRVPHIEGKKVVDGDVSVKVRGKQRFLLGTSGEAYVVQVLRKERFQVVRVRPGAEEVRLVQSSPEQVLLSDDGSTIAVLDKIARRTSIDVRSAVDGELLATGRGFRGYPSLLDLDGDHLVVASFEEGATDYDWTTGSRTTITKRPVYRADISSDRMALFTDDPYDGGCTVVAPLTRPKKKIWRSCEEAVLRFSPDGKRMVNTYILADGLGPNRVSERKVRGRLLASYKVGGFFGAISWESETDLLIDANARKKAATVRCSAGDCERASDLRATPVYRPTVSAEEPLFSRPAG
ncbi:hypothetical protein [Nocardioides sp.]|uniref:hypothetical protein n=1 Tax=Nocardioides sp. TaxID=35761 RepID=UPI0023A54EAA|nr:hypothetical protein [Nocardioides sp.]MDE0777910.1 hypothetical protein [Nocardioides sp.]